MCSAPCLKLFWFTVKQTFWNTSQLLCFNINFQYLHIYVRGNTIEQVFCKIINNLVPGATELTNGRLHARRLLESCDHTKLQCRTKMSLCNKSLSKLMLTLFTNGYMYYYKAQRSYFGVWIIEVWWHIYIIELVLIGSGNGLFGFKPLAELFMTFFIWPGAHLIKNWLKFVPAILQITFSNAFAWMKMGDFQLKFHWRLFLRVQLTILQHWLR